MTSLTYGYSQKTQKFYIPDSLQKRSYKELFESFNVNYSDTSKAKIFAKAYLHKAKNENDTIKIANGYSQLASIYSLNDFSISLKYSDSIILLTQNIINPIYPGFGYMIKGLCLFELGSYKEALENYIIAYDYSKKNKKTEQLFYIKNAIGELKYFWGNYSEALDIFKSQFKEINKPESKKFINYNQLYFSVLYKLSNAYILTKKNDSALIFTTKGIIESKSQDNSSEYYKFVSQSGIIAYYQKNYQTALDSLDKALPFEKSTNALFNQHYYRGLIFKDLNSNEKAFHHFKKADSIYEASQDVVPEVRDIQEYFVNYYKQANDIENQLKYIDRLLYIDSIIKRNSIHLNEAIVKKYDTPQLLSEKEKIIKSLNSKNKKSSLIIYLLSLIILVALSVVIWLVRKHRLYKQRFNKLISGNLKDVNLSEKASEKLMGIPEETLQLIIDGLNNFEANNLFLDNSITLNSLSKSLNTNSNYLSKIINFYKGKNFSTYISDLRIDYCIKTLKESEICRKYSIKAIANEVGFNNAESFSKAFYKKTGIYPSYFIKKIEKQESTK